MDFLYQLDVNILLGIQNLFHSDVLTPIMKAITHMGDKGYVWIALSLFFCIFKKTRKVGVIALFSLVCVWFVNNEIIKVLVHRTRPFNAVPEVVRLIKAPKDYSFPSGHTAAAFAAAVVFFQLLPEKIGIPIIAFACLMGFTRMYVGVHYPSDVLGGAVVGTVGALLSIWVSRKISAYIEKRHKK